MNTANQRHMPKIAQNTDHYINLHQEQERFSFAMYHTTEAISL